jgi:hypothetical protein
MPASLSPQSQTKPQSQIKPRSQIKLDDYILDTLLRDLTGHDRRPAAFLVYLWLVGEQSRRKIPVIISYQDLAENTGLSRSSAQSAISWLIRRKLLSSTKANATAIPRYTAQFPWRKYAAL